MLLDVAVAAARDARRLVGQSTGQPPWAAQADAAEARVALARGDNEAALGFARQALGWLQDSHRDDPHLEILLPAARALIVAGTDQEKQMIGGLLHAYLALGAARVMNEDVRMRWFRSATGSELVELTGPIETPKAAKGAKAATTKAADGQEQELDERETKLLRLLVQGRSNREIGEEMHLDEVRVGSMLTALYGRIGTSSRAETTAFAIRAI
jgi:DNA-binding CsgD family transcriptional regulator